MLLGADLQGLHLHVWSGLETFHEPSKHQMRADWLCPRKVLQEDHHNDTSPHNDTGPHNYTQDLRCLPLPTFLCNSASPRDNHLHSRGLQQRSMLLEDYHDDSMQHNNEGCPPFPLHNSCSYGSSKPLHNSRNALVLCEG